jgi:hypothetical protein
VPIIDGATASAVVIVLVIVVVFLFVVIAGVVLVIVKAAGGIKCLRSTESRFLSFDLVLLVLIGPFGLIEYRHELFALVYS